MSVDLSGLTDDQLISLAEACCQEAVARNPGVSAAMRDMMLSEAEKIRIARNATEIEIAAARARERERVVAAASAAAREKIDRATAAERTQRAVAAAQNAAEAEREKLNAQRRAIVDMAALINTDPRTISILVARTAHGRRLLVNSGRDRWKRDHLVDYTYDTGRLATVRAAVKNKPEIAALCVTLRHLLDGTHIIGEDII